MIDGDHGITRYPLGVAHEEAKLPADARPASRFVSLWMKSWQQFHFHDTGDAAAVKRPHPSNDTLRLKTQADNPAAYLYRLRALPGQAAACRRIVDTIKLAAPFFGGFVAREPVPEPVDLEWFEQSDPATPYRAHVLSDGTLRFIGLTTLLLQPLRLLPDIVLIAEPEPGLHPFAINLLADMMKQVSRVQQLIVSTQSVELLNALEPEHVVVAQMRRVVIVCEGQTEEAFISRLLFPAFVDAGLHLQGITVETWPGHKRGALRYARLRSALPYLLRDAAHP